MTFLLYELCSLWTHFFSHVRLAIDNVAEFHGKFDKW